MSNTGESCERDVSLEALPLQKPIKFHVIQDVGGCSIIGQEGLRGYTSAGTTYAQALAIFIESILVDYYCFYLHPSEGENKEDIEQGLRLRAIFWPRGMKDEGGLR